MQAALAAGQGKKVYKDYINSDKAPLNGLVKDLVQRRIMGAYAGGFGLLAHLFNAPRLKLLEQWVVNAVDVVVAEEGNEIAV